MAYAILRTDKISNTGNLGSSLEHAKRERETPNANLEIKNKILVDGNLEKHSQMLEGVKTRSNSVQAVDIFLGASPEFFEGKNQEQIREWADESIKFIDKIFGKDNVLSAVLHLDEKEPHIQAHAIPIETKKDGSKSLNCRKWLGGKGKLQKLQDEYAKSMSKFGLERGERGSVAKHEDIKKYYERIKEPTKDISIEINLPKPSIPDMLSKERYSRIAGEIATEQTKPIIEKLQLENRELKYKLKKQSGELKSFARSRDAQREVNLNLQHKIERLEPVFDIVKSTPSINISVRQEMNRREEIKRQEEKRIAQEKEQKLLEKERLEEQKRLEKEKNEQEKQRLEQEKLANIPIKVSVQVLMTQSLERLKQNKDISKPVAEKLNKIVTEARKITNRSVKIEIPQCNGKVQISKIPELLRQKQQEIQRQKKLSNQQSIKRGGISR